MNTINFSNRYFMKLKPTMTIALCLISSFSCNANHVASSEAIAAMTLPNDDVLYGAPTQPSWAKGATIAQGRPRGDAAPIWWTDDVLDKSIIDSDPWNGMTIWFTGFEAQSNRINDFRVAMSRPEVWLLHASDEKRSISKAYWERLPDIQFSWSAYFSRDVANYIEDADATYLDNGELKYQISSDHYPTHGGTQKIEIDGENVLGVFVRVRAWLEPTNGISKRDLSDAKYLINIGADYYPNVDSDVAAGDFAGTGYLPGAMGSRFAYVSEEPRWFYAATVSQENAEIVDKSSRFIKNGGRTYLTQEELLRNSPDIDSY
ncbi:hypothetical protein [Vibrio sinaloensis]|uniref:hypothetical protein n=1 Tax=Photobacterium sp. (strain ATCC 43367) TaxID=379097 RepID=UPI0035EE21DA